MRLVNLHGLHQRVLLATLHGSPWRVRVRLPAWHPLLASSATYTTLTPLLRHCLTILHGCVDTSRTSPTSPLRGVLVQVACAEPAPPDPFSVRGLGSSPPVQLPVYTRRGNTRDVGSLVQPVLCTAYWFRVPARPPAHPESMSLRDCGSSLPFQLPAPHSEGRC